MVKCREFKNKKMKNKEENLPFLESFTKKEKESIFPLLKEEVFTENQIIFQKGDFGNKMYFIESGKVKIYDTQTGLTSKIVEVFSV